MIIKIGHRGACGYEPENTLSSFKKALELNVNMIELDARVCKSGEVVVIHDPHLKRITNKRELISRKTYEQLKRLNLPKQQKIPTLQEALDTINRKTKVNIELKRKKIIDRPVAKAVSKIIEQYINKKNWKSNDFLVSSFNHKELLKFKKLCPKIKIGLLFKKIPRNIAKTLKNPKIYSIHLKKTCISKQPEIIKQAHSNGKKVFVYIFNKLPDIKRMKSLGVDGIISDYPDRI